MNGILIQFLTALILSLTAMLTSFAIAWPSYTVPLFESDHSPLGEKITAYQGNLIGSLPMLGSLISCLSAGFVAEAIGRKHTEILCGVCFCLGWSLVTTAKTIMQIFIGRLVIGIASGVNVVVAFVFIGEIAQLSIKGTVTVLIVFIYNMGTLLSYIQGWLCSYEVICYSNLVVSVIFIVLMSFLKETPAYLLGKRKEKEALDSLKFYRGVLKATEDVLEELAYIRNQRISNDENITSDLEKYIRKTENDNLDQENAKEDLEMCISTEKEKLHEENEIATKPVETSGWKLLFTSNANLRALITVSLEMILGVCTGMAVVLTYAEKFFTEATPTISPQMSSILVGILMLVGSLLALVITDRVGRRILLTSTSVIATVCLAAIASLLRWSWGPDWSIIAFILLYCISYQLGVINIPFVQLTESFGPKVSSMALAIIMSLMYLANFAVLFVYGPIVEYLGLDVVFFMFSIIGIFTTGISILIVKETRRQPIGAVQEMYARGYLWHR